MLRADMWNVRVALTELSAHFSADWECETTRSLRMERNRRYLHQAIYRGILGRNQGGEIYETCPTSSVYASFSEQLR